MRAGGGGGGVRPGGSMFDFFNIFNISGILEVFGLFLYQQEDLHFFSGKHEVFERSCVYKFGYTLTISPKETSIIPNFLRFRGWLCPLFFPESTRFFEVFVYCVWFCPHWGIAWCTTSSIVGFWVMPWWLRAVDD